jgi:hypothetical protein
VKALNNVLQTVAKYWAFHYIEPFFLRILFNVSRSCNNVRIYNCKYINESNKIHPNVFCCTHWYMSNARKTWKISRIKLQNLMKYGSLYSLVLYHNQLLKKLTILNLKGHCIGSLRKKFKLDLYLSFQILNTRCGRNSWVVSEIKYGDDKTCTTFPLRVHFVHSEQVTYSYIDEDKYLHSNWDWIPVHPLPAFQKLAYIVRGLYYWKVKLCNVTSIK